MAAGGHARAALLVAAALTSAWAPACAPGWEPPEHLVLVTLDTLRADHVGAYGAPLATPALDALAEQGVLLEDAFTPTPTTGPAHASLFTGLHPWRHRVLDNGVPLGPGASTLAEHLRAAGFTTQAFVSSYVLHPRFGMDRGFDAYSLVSTHDAQWRGRTVRGFYARGEATTERALQALGEHRDAGEGRLFLWVHYFDPHAPYEPPPGFAVDDTHPLDLRGKWLPAEAGPVDLEPLLRSYAGEVRYVDDQLGRLVAGLEELGLLERTALVVTSDHGEGLGDHGLLQHGANLYDELVRVPLLLRAPGLPAGRRLAGGAQLEDLMPTLLSLMGVPAPAGRDGVDLLPWLRGELPQSPRPEVFGRRKDYAGVAATYFAWGPGRKWIGELGGPALHFDLRRDPGEVDGRESVEMPPGLRARLGRAVRRGDAQQLDAEARSALEALGYLDGEEAPAPPP